MAQTFSDQVAVTFYDTSQPDVQVQFSKIMTEASEQFWPYPLVIIDDQPVMAGSVNEFRVIMLVSQLLSSN